ncbi:MAG: alpha/beta fold hydrolase [Bacteroidales bacterium]|nr:alpha/beta fold hydrolase [Bacteroidales bacterium]
MRYFGNDIRIFVNNLMVSYTDEGADEAPVLIFIHGFPLNKFLWNKQVEALKDNYRVIAYDIRGHGDSEAGNIEFSIELFVNDLICFMDALKIEKASICGLSMGGYIALNAIENYPERFDALVLSDTHCIADSSETKEKRIKSIESIKENGVEKYVEESIKSLFASESFTTKVPEIEAVREMILNTPEQSLYKTLLALYVREETCNILDKIKVPVLVMVGEEDKITPPGAARFMHEKIQDSTLYIVKHAGHLSNMESPDEFNAQLKMFFASVYKKPLSISVSDNHSIVKQLQNQLSFFFSF